MREATKHLYSEDYLLNRVPVVNPNQTPAMPCKASRARRMVRDSKAIGKKNKLGIYYIQLIDEPSGKETQSISVGVDTKKKLFQQLTQSME
jgi:hypothetical protein